MLRTIVCRDQVVLVLRAHVRTIRRPPVPDPVPLDYGLSACQGGALFYIL